MTKYVITRLLTVIPIILGIIFILFTMLYVLPYSQISLMPAYGGGDALDSVFTFFNASDNFFTKYVRYCYNIFFHFEFGMSPDLPDRLSNEIPGRTRATLTVLASGGVAAFIIGIPLGIYSAVHKNSIRDRLINIVALLFTCIPSYAMALVVALLFVLQLGILPMNVPRGSPESYVMPSVTIALVSAASIARITRTSMLEVLELPYITALRSKGLKEVNVIYKHAFKNALVPVTSVLGGFVTQLLCGTFIVESFFNIPGLGFLLLGSVRARNHFGILGCTVVMTVFLALANILVDVIYAFVNPQIKLRYMSTGIVKLRKEEAG